MQRFLPALSIILFLFLHKGWAQSNQTVTNGAQTTAVNFPGAGCIYNWVNDMLGIGLAASGTGDIGSFTAVNNGNGPVTATITATPAPSGNAYIANLNDGTVSVINVATNAVISTIKVGIGPFGVWVSPDGSRAYVENNDSNTISVINTTTNTIVSTINTGGAPEGLAVSPDGNTIYVANFGNNNVTAINTATNAIVATIMVGVNPDGITISPDGSLIYVINYGTNDVYVINTATNSVVATIPVGITPETATISPDGSRVYVVCASSDNVSVINALSNKVIAVIPVGTSPIGVSLSPDGTRAYVTNENSNNVSVINTSSNKVVSTIAVGSSPGGICISPDGSRIFVANYLSNNVSVINVATNMVTATVNVGSGPFSLGNFFTNGTGCNGSPIKFTITVNPTPAIPPTITTGTPTGSIFACAGTASVSPQIQQFTVSGTNLTGNITATAPTSFEVSLSAASGYGGSVTITPTGGTISNTVVYVRSAATAAIGNISGKLTLSSTGAVNQTVAVSGIVSALPTVNTVASQTVANGTATTAINFTGTGNTFTWVNDRPGIGLAASGTGNIASFTAVNNGKIPITATITVTPGRTGFAYIPDSDDSTVSVINTATNTLVSTITVGLYPQGVSVSPDGSTVYITNSGSKNVSVINTATNTVTATIKVGLTPHGVTFSPDGSKVYVANVFSNTISVINTATDMVIATIPANINPSAIAVSHDGSQLYVTDETANTMSVISTLTNKIISNITVSSPQFLCISEDGSVMYVANYNSQTVSVINTTTYALVKTINVGVNPCGISISPDGSQVFVTNEGSNTVSVINTVTNNVVLNIPVGAIPNGISISPDGSLLYVVNTKAETVSVINTQTYLVTATIPLPSPSYFFGNFILGGANCSGTPVTFTITVKPASAAAISSAGTLSSLTTTYGTPSASEIFNLSGTGLTAGILVTPPPGFEVGADNVTFTNTVTIGSGGTIALMPVYIRLAAITPVGNYSGGITLSSTGASNIALMPVSTVNPAPLTIVADNKSKIYGEPNPVLTVSYNGFVNNEGPIDLIVMPVLTTTAVIASPVGVYPIIASGAESLNYKISYIQGLLTVLPAEQSIVIPNAFTPNGDGINDTWNIKSLDLYLNCSVNIFNRYGQKIYSSIGYGIPWDGTYNSAALPVGTYYYIIDLKNGLKVLSGFVAIIR